MKIKILAAGIALTLPFWACAKDVTIIYTNDLHAHVEPYKVPWIADGKRDIGGWANITTLVKQEKAKNKATWFFDAGDYFTGPYISSLTKGKAIIDIMNTMPFDAVTIGNHEFDHGWDNTLLQLSQAKFPIVQGNVFYQNSSKSFWDKPYTIIEKDGVKAVDSAEELYKTCNVVSLHIPATAETKNSINYALLKDMPKGAILVNTARKEVINEDELIQLMQDRPDFKYITDIMPAANAKFAELFVGRYFSTPKKMGAQTAEANINAGIAAAKQIVGFLKDGCEKFRVNK